MSAARAAVAGLDLCVEAAALARSSVKSDLGTAASLLSGAANALLFSAAFNLRGTPDASESERRQLEDRALRQTRAVFRDIS